jgi:NAD(P)H-nitrite reductase large subunit
MINPVEPSNRIHFSEDILFAPLEEMVCYCSGVTRAQILDAIQAGTWSLEQLKAATGACTVAKCAELSPRKR